MDSAVREFWDKRAESHKDSDLATCPDSHYRKLEISRIIPHIQKHAKILDVGCGNGYSTFKFAEAMPSAKIIGIDYSVSMIKYAINTMRIKQSKNVSFMVSNVLDVSRLQMKFDIIICERCLINLKDWEEQRKAITQMQYCLNTGGKLVLVENTLEGLANLNAMRAKFDLRPIEVRWHNCYLPQKELLDFLKQNFVVQNVENIGNFYYLASRVIYAKMCAVAGVEPDYNHAINAIASQMPSLPGYHYSPNYMIVARVKS